jgi:hypothetical protein
MPAWPPALRTGSFDAKLNFDIADHPIYDGLELQSSREGSRQGWRGSPRQSWRGDSAFVDQWMVNGADAATLYGVVTLLFNWTM